MKRHNVMTSKTLVFAGLILAVLLAAAGMRTSRTTLRFAGKASSLTELDQRARSFFEEAEKNIPKVVSELTGTQTFLNLCYLAITDKVTGSDKLDRKLASVIEGPILVPCRKGAAIYGCTINPALARGYLSSLHRDSMTSALYASGGLALEAAFLKTTLKSVQCVIGPIAGKIAAKFGTGAALAAADGPLPFGDAVGVVLAVGGTAWSVHDLLVLRRDLPSSISAALRQAIQEYWKQCRLEAAK